MSNARLDTTNGSSFWATPCSAFASVSCCARASRTPTRARSRACVRSWSTPKRLPPGHAKRSSPRSYIWDAVPALIAAVYLDVGLEAARAACARIVADELQALESDGTRDPKSELQERLQAIGGGAPTYELIETGGPAHKRWFKVGVRQGERRLAEGSGSSKRAAERAAAASALQLPDLIAEMSGAP